MRHILTLISFMIKIEMMVKKMWRGEKMSEKMPQKQTNRSESAENKENLQKQMLERILKEDANLLKRLSK